MWCWREQIWNRKPCLTRGFSQVRRSRLDLQVPEKSVVTYSLMDYLGSQGFDVFALDYQNYGRSDKHACGLCVTTQVAANDVNAAIRSRRRTRVVCSSLRLPTPSRWRRG